ncbi:MAG: hypothetical protein LBI53_07975 [Candidatus Peribacteria bacterium]|jgi:hypothetical protein|nr:hypothetical protein [Candidatus Peribacteria bacterium]
MPKHFYEIEHSTDFQNSLLKFVELQDFNAKFTIVADHRRKQGYETKLLQVAFKDIAPRVKFLDYKNLSDLHTKTYELFTIKTILGLDLSLQKYRS